MESRPRLDKAHAGLPDAGPCCWPSAQRRGPRRRPSGSAPRRTRRTSHAMASGPASRRPCDIARLAPRRPARAHRRVERSVGGRHGADRRGLGDHLPCCRPALRRAYLAAAHPFRDPYGWQFLADARTTRPRCRTASRCGTGRSVRPGALAVRPRSVATHDATPPWATRPEHAIVAVRVGDEPALTQLARRPAGASSSGSMTPA